MLASEPVGGRSRATELPCFSQNGSRLYRLVGADNSIAMLWILLSSTLDAVTNIILR